MTNQAKYETLAAKMQDAGLVDDFSLDNARDAGHVEGSDAFWSFRVRDLTNVADMEGFLK